MNDLEILYDLKFIGSRITELRLKMDPIPSERDISLRIGQNPSYITKITAGKSNPNMERFFLICEFFGITPMEFFNEYEENPSRDREILTQLKEIAGDNYNVAADFILSLNKEKTQFLLQILKDFRNKDERRD